MKLLNIFKKQSSAKSETKNSNIQKLDTKQLSKVIGGGGPDTADSTAGAINTSRSNIRNPS